MEINGHSPTKVNGKEYWTVKQFSSLSQRSEQTIRVYISKGNRKRKLDSIRIGNTRLIPVEELFDFPFLTDGRPSHKYRDYGERFYLENDELLREEVIIEWQ